MTSRGFGTGGKTGKSEITVSVQHKKPAASNEIFGVFLHRALLQCSMVLSRQNGYAGLFQGKIFPGLRMLRGSKTCLILFWRAISSGLITMGM